MLAQLKAALFFWICVPIFLVGSGKLLDRMLTLPSIGVTSLRWAAIPLICTGILFIVRAMHDLESLGHGTPNPLAPPCRLVKNGIYRFCRHPMYFGYDLIALACAFWLQSLGMLIFPIPLFFICQIRFLLKEERRLEKRFGGTYRCYKDNVPMLIPFPPLWRRKISC